MAESRFQAAIEKIDAANAEDPNKETFNGKEVPKEVLYAQRMTNCLLEFAPDASEAVRLAARCQHIQRWKIPRSDYPMDRKGYKKWRSTLAQFHAEKAGEILREVGYEAEIIERVKTLLVKRGLKRNAEVQQLEDIICLVFMKYYLTDFAKKHDEPKIVEIIQKTWKKMSEKGQQAALNLELSYHLKILIKRALVLDYK